MIVPRLGVVVQIRMNSHISTIKSQGILSDIAQRLISLLIKHQKGRISSIQSKVGNPSATLSLTNLLLETKPRGMLRILRFISLERCQGRTISRNTYTCFHYWIIEPYDPTNPVVMVGTILVHNAIARTLFDMGATHSLMG